QWSGAPNNQQWSAPGGNSAPAQPPVETKTGLEILGDSLVELFDKYVKIQCLPHLVEGLQKEGFQVNFEKLECLLPQRTTVARSALLSAPSAVAAATTAPFSASFNMPIGVAPQNQPFGAPQAGAFNATGFMPSASASTADKNAMEKQKLLDPNFNDNY